MAKHTFQDVEGLFDMPKKIVRLVQELASQDPALARTVVAKLSAVVGIEPEAGRPSSARQQERGSSVYDAVADYFVRSGNKPVLKTTLVKGSGVNEGSLHTLLYGGPKSSCFQIVKNPEGGRARIISLTHDAYEEAKGKQGVSHDLWMKKASS